MRLIVVSSPVFLANEATLLNKMFALGMEILHLRKPNASEKDCAELLENIDNQYHTRISIHQHFQLCKRYCLKGVHLNSRYSDANGFEHLGVSKSCHNLLELSDIDKFEYVFLSPIFDSISKQNYKSAFTEKDLQKAKSNSLINRKVIALGGVNSATFPLLEAMGFGGGAVLGAIWNSKSPVESFKHLKML
ncbi:MAG: thiamine phosphate synthase [Bacteroidales bacterium]|jgi:thiamine-phosphate pyrophosphorylase|nr:thiamine phosphate synthase [Bacteroidales bacterium]